MTGHTPTPWAVENNPRRTRVRIVAANNTPVAVIECASANTPEARNTAAFIVRACNAHDDLVSALEAWRAFSGCCLHESTFASPAFIEARKLTRAALAKAGAP